MKKRTIGQVLRLSRVNLHLSLQDIIKLGHKFIDQAEMVDYMIFQK